jgi:hypothetical protein
MRTATLRTTMTAALAAAAFVGCTDAATGPGEVRVAPQFEALAAQAIAAGDLAGGERLRVVANALHYGVRPSRYEAWTGQRVEEYLALVVVEEHRGLEPYTHERFDRFFYMWHNGEAENLHLLRMKTTGEQGWMEQNAADPGAAEYMEGLGPFTHLSAFAGVGRVAEIELGAPCDNAPAARETHLVQCNRGLFRVGFEVELGHDDEVGAATHLTMRGVAQRVRGIKWTLYDRN